MYDRNFMYGRPPTHNNYLGQQTLDFEFSDSEKKNGEVANPESNTDSHRQVTNTKSDQSKKKNY